MDDESLRVLIIEDDAHMVESLMRGLRAECGPGIAIDHAGTLSAALELMHAHTYRLISLDLKIPRTHAADEPYSVDEETLRAVLPEAQKQSAFLVAVTGGIRSEEAAERIRSAVRVVMKTDLRRGRILSELVGAPDLTSALERLRQARRGLDAELAQWAKSAGGHAHV